MLLRAGLLLVLLVAEVLGLTLRFDGEELARRPQAWVRWLAEGPVLLRGGLAFVAAFLLVASPRRHAIAGALARASTGHRWGRWLGLHLAAVGVFWACTAQLFERGAESPWWGVGWLAAAGATPTLWLLSLAPARSWGVLARREHRGLMLAILAGAGAAASARVTQTLWDRLAAATFWCVERLLGVLYTPMVSVPAELTLGTPAFQVTIDRACSGYEGIALISLFLALYFWLFRGALRFPHALLLLPVGVVTIWLTNVVRIALLVAIGTSISPGVALGGFHSQAGWLFFLLVSLGSMAAGHRLRLFAARPGPRPDAPRPRGGALDAAALLVPAVVLLVSIIVTSAASSGFDRWYPLRLVATGAALWHFRAAYRRLDWRWTWPSAGIGVTVFILWLALETPRVAQGSEIQAGLGQLTPTGVGLWLVSRILGSIITVPLAEELAFRGYLTRKLISPAFETVRLGQFTWLSFVGSSVAFGLLHGRWIAGTLAGMAYAAALYRRGQLGDAVHAHLTTNALIAAYVLGAGRWSLWS